MYSSENDPVLQAVIFCLMECLKRQAFIMHKHTKTNIIINYCLADLY